MKHWDPKGGGPGSLHNNPILYPIQKLKISFWVYLIHLMFLLTTPRSLGNCPSLQNLRKIASPPHWNLLQFRKGISYLPLGLLQESIRNMCKIRLPKQFPCFTPMMLLLLLLLRCSRLLTRNFNLHKFVDWEA